MFLYNVTSTHLPSRNRIYVYFPQIYLGLWLACDPQNAVEMILPDFLGKVGKVTQRLPIARAFSSGVI